MAMLRSSTVVPLALRAISSPRIGWLSATKSALTAESPIVSDRHFSTDSASSSKSVTRKLVGLLKSEIKNYDLALAKAMAVPDKLPFTIEDDPAYCHVMLRRDTDDEKIEVTVNPIYDVPSDSDSDDNSSSEKEKEKEEEEEFRVGPVQPPPKSVDINVSIIKEEKGTIDIGAYVSAKKIVVHKISFTEPNQFYPAVRYNVMDDGGLLDYLLLQFVEIRGIEIENVGFLYDYMVGKRRRWRTERPSAADFKKLKKFIEEW